VSRNAFENNSPQVDLAGIEDKVFMVLPPLPAGEFYELEHVGDRVVVTIEKS
jgi:hypothetical protein